MNPNLCRVALRRRGPLEVFDLSLVFGHARLRPLLLMTLLTVGPLFLLCIPLCWYFDGHPGLLAIPAVAAPFLQAPFTMLTGRLLFADEVPLWSALKDVIKAGPQLVAAWLTELLGWMLVIASCGYGAVLVQPALLYMTETALLERVGPGRGLRRSLRLAGGHVGIALMGAAARWVLIVWFAVVAEASGQAIVGFILQLGEPFGSAWQGDVTPYLLLGLMLSQPAHAVYRLLLYVDVRTRVEGWDLQVGLRAAGLGR